MPNISEPTATELVKDVIYETGLFSPRGAITTRHRFKEDYGLEGRGPIAAFTSRINGRFKPYGKTISPAQMAGCKRVSNLVSLLASSQNALTVKTTVVLEAFLAKRGTARVASRRLAMRRCPS